jgi:hypothetical protein
LLVLLLHRVLLHGSYCCCLLALKQPLLLLHLLGSQLCALLHLSGSPALLAACFPS